MDSTGDPMTCARTVLLILFLLAGSLSPPEAGAQSAATLPPRTEVERGFELEQNYPNPVNPETWIPFYLDPVLFRENQEVLVSMRIYNILSQPVAIPEAVDHSRGPFTPIINLPFLEPGRNVAYWDGTDTAGRPVPSGVYYVQMVVGGEEPLIRKLVVLNERRRRRIFPW